MAREWGRGKGYRKWKRQNGKEKLTGASSNGPGVLVLDLRGPGRKVGLGALGLFSTEIW